MLCLRAAVFVSIATILVAGHGMIHDPPGRSTAWRHGFKTPVNVDDNELFCGGFMRQWRVNDGKCGVCGDAWDGPRRHEAGGIYATGTIVKTYKTDQVIPIHVQLTANHLGYFEFRMCVNNDVNKRATQECFDQHLLQLADGSGTRVPIDSSMFHVYTKLRLPAGVECDQCIIQWKYNTGNSWGVDPVTHEAGMGFGIQEQFYGCADVAINAQGHVAPGPEDPMPSTTISPTRKPLRTTTERKTTTKRPRSTTTIFPTRGPLRTTTERKTTTKRPRSTTTTTTPVTTPSTSRPGGNTRRCRGVGFWHDNEEQAEWCEFNCAHDHCPEELCICQDLVPATTKPPVHSRTTSRPGGSSTRRCRGAGFWKHNEEQAEWCEFNCANDHCPEELCVCEDRDLPIRHCRGVGFWEHNQEQAEWCEFNCANGHCPEHLCHCS